MSFKKKKDKIKVAAVIIQVQSASLETVKREFLLAICHDE